MLSSYNTPTHTHTHTHNTQHRSNKTEKAGPAKGDRDMQRGQSIYQVLCVNTEPGANARREVRGDLKDSVVA
jgi:hypothetical protein